MKKILSILLFFTGTMLFSQDIYYLPLVSGLETSEAEFTTRIIASKFEKISGLDIITDNEIDSENSNIYEEAEQHDANFVINCQVDEFKGTRIIYIRILNTSDQKLIRGYEITYSEIETLLSELDSKLGQSVSSISNKEENNEDDEEDDSEDKIPFYIDGEIFYVTEDRFENDEVFSKAHRLDITSKIFVYSGGGIALYGLAQSLVSLFVWAYTMTNDSYGDYYSGLALKSLIAGGVIAGTGLIVGLFPGLGIRSAAQKSAEEVIREERGLSVIPILSPNSDGTLTAGFSLSIKL